MPTAKARRYIQTFKPGKPVTLPWIFRYSEVMQDVTITLPEELLAALGVSGMDLSRAALEALALEAYRTHKISAAQLRRLLGLPTRMAVDAFLKERGVELEYSIEDLERDRETHRRLGL